MTPSGSGSDFSPTQALMLTRVIYVTSAVLLVILAGLIFAAIRIIDISPRPGAAWIGTGVGFAALLICALAASWLRGQIYKRNWVGHHVTPKGYVAAHVAVYSLYEAAYAVSMIAVLITGLWIPAGIPAWIALVIHLVIYPHGRPMVDTPPNLDELEKQVFR